MDRSILVLDAPTDVRGIYVPMTRGRHHNDAYITATGEQIAVDVFAESLASSWIDQPALARQADLSGSNTHRPGTLPDHELRALLDQKAQLTGALTQLDNDLRWLPRERQAIEGELRHAGERLDRDRDRLRTAEAYLEQHDRPLRRRGHESGITTARGTSEVLPGQIHDRQTDIIRLQDQLQGVEHKQTKVEALKLQRPDLETRLNDITARLDDDTTIRSRQTRRDPPDRIVDTLGMRPPAGKIAQTWDATAGRLDQHQTAYQLTTGIGPNHKPTVPDGFHQSRQVVTAAMRNLNQATNQQQRGISHPGLGISR